MANRKVSGRDTGTSVYAAFSPFASHPGMTESGRLSPFPLQSLPGFKRLLKGKSPLQTGHSTDSNPQPSPGPLGLIRCTHPLPPVTTGNSQLDLRLTRGGWRGWQKMKKKNIYALRQHPARGCPSAPVTKSFPVLPPPPTPAGFPMEIIGFALGEGGGAAMGNLPSGRQIGSSEATGVCLDGLLLITRQYKDRLKVRIVGNTCRPVDIWER